MSRHYKPGESDDLDFVRMPPSSHVPNIREELTEADDDPSDDELEDMDDPEDDDDRAGVL